MTNLRQDSVISNAMSADTAFVINHHQMSLPRPFLIIAATDGCFGYLPSPMHFEWLLLSTLRDASGPRKLVDADAGADQRRSLATTPRWPSWGSAPTSMASVSCSPTAPPTGRAVGEPLDDPARGVTDLNGNSSAAPPADAQTAATLGRLPAGLRAIPRRPAAIRRAHREGRGHRRRVHPARGLPGRRRRAERMDLRRTRRHGTSSSNGSSAPPTPMTPRPAARPPSSGSAPDAPRSRRTTGESKRLSPRSPATAAT